MITDPTYDRSIRPGLGPRGLYLENKGVLGEQLVLGEHSRCSSTFQKCSPRLFFKPGI